MNLSAMRLTPLLFIVLAAPAAAQEIVVTGERRPQSVQTLAGNTARLSAEDLQRVDAQAASEALNRLPGVAIHRNNGVENLPAIRSPVLTGGQSAGSFLVLEDGVPIRAPGFGNVNDLFETSLDFADAVEVVRGPGSALYGSNAVHGVVNVITPQIRQALNPTDWEGCASSHRNLRRGEIETSSTGASRANFLLIDRHQSIAANNVGVCGNEPYESFVAGSLLALAATDAPGWRDASGVDQQHVLVGWDSYIGPWILESRFVFQNLNQETAAFVEGVDAYDSGALSRANAAPEAFRDQQLARARVTLSRQFGDWELRATPYARWIDAQLLLSFFPSRALEETSQSGGGVQSALYWDASDALTFIFGADVDSTRGAVREFQARVTQPNGYEQGLHYDYSVDMLTIAAYAQARWRFARDWSATAGLRGERVRYAYDNEAPSDDFGRFRRPADRDDEFNALTPKLGLVWTPREGQALYLNLARGARPPQIVDLYSLQITQTSGAQAVETIDSAEIGWRGALGPAQVELAVYHMDKRDTSFRNADGFTVTDGRTRHEGVEFSADVRVTDTLSVGGWASYARHTYRFADPSARAGETIVAGNDVDSAPRWLWNARASWRPLERIELELEWAHMGAYFTNAENTRTYPGHDVLNLRGEWKMRDDVSVFAAVRNLTNTDYAERADFAFGNDRYFPGEDRGFTLGVRARR